MLKVHYQEVQVKFGFLEILLNMLKFIKYKTLFVAYLKKKYFMPTFTAIFYQELKYCCNTLNKCFCKIAYNFISNCFSQSFPNHLSGVLSGVLGVHISALLHGDFLYYVQLANYCKYLKKYIILEKVFFFNIS